MSRLVMPFANPKAILFFTALLPQFINPEFPATRQFIALGLVSITVQGSVLVAYGWLRESPFARWLDRLAGGFLVGAGVKLALTDKP